MTHNYILLFALLLIVLSGCKDATPIAGELFKEKWTTSDKHSAVSWWYLGEDKEQYFIAEKWPNKENIYIVSKNIIVISGIKIFQFNSGEKPVNLKNNHVVIK